MKVFLIEDALQVRKRLRSLLQTIPGVTVVGEAESVSAGIKGVLGSDVGRGASIAIFLLPVLLVMAVLMLRVSRRAEVL